MDEIQRLIMKVEGEAELKRLTSQQERQLAIMNRLIEAYDQQKISQASYDQRMTAMAGALSRTNAQLDAAAESLGGGPGGGTGGGKGLGNALMQAGYIVDDFVAGLNNQGLAGALANVQNNIPGLLLALGKGAGLAGAIGVAGVAVAQLVRHWDDLAGLWKDGSVAEQAEQMKKFGAAAKEAADAIERQVKAAREQKSPDQSATAAAVSAQTGGPDFDKVVANAAGDMTGVDKQKADLQRQIEQQQEIASATPRDRRALGQGPYGTVNGPHPADVAEARAKELQDQLDALTDTAKNAVDKAKQMAVAARNGDMKAYDWLLANTTGDVHAKLASADPRKAGMRGMARDRAVKQIGDAIGDAVNPIVTAMKGRRAAEKQGIDQARAIDRQQDQGAAEAQRLQDAETRRKADWDRAQQRRNNQAGRSPNGLVTTPEQAERFKAMSGIQAGGREMAAMEQQAAQIAQQMQAGAAQGFDVSGLQTQLQMIQRAYAQQDAKMQQLQLFLSRGMGGQMGGGGFSALPMYQGGQ